MSEWTGRAPTALGPSAASPGAGLRRLLQSVVKSLLLWHERAHQRRQLLTLDDHMLKDIGLSRADVEAEYDKPVWRP